MTTEEKRLAHNQKVREWRLSNPEKHKATQKKQDSRPERLESKRKRMAEWRKNNPDKQKEIANRSYRNCFEKNRDKDNERARKQWLNEEYREKRLKKMAQTRQENRDLFCVDCGKELPKHKSKYCEYCKDKNYKIKVEEWRIKAGNKYINELQNKRVKKKVDMLTITSPELM